MYVLISIRCCYQSCQSNNSLPIDLSFQTNKQTVLISSHLIFFTISLQLTANQAIVFEIGTVKWNSLLKRTLYSRCWWKEWLLHSSAPTFTTEMVNIACWLNMNWIWLNGSVGIYICVFRAAKERSHSPRSRMESIGSVRKLIS